MSSFDKIIHEPARLRILTLLVNSDEPPVSFNTMQEKLAMSSGNLSVQLKKLKTTGYVSISKTFKDNKPYTTIMITPAGSTALVDYVEHMESILKTLKENT